MPGPIVLASPQVYLPGTLLPLGWERLKLTWTGWDGSQWDLTNPEGGVFLTLDGVEGLGALEHEDWVQDSPAVPGQWYKGERALPRRIFWPLLVWNPDSRGTAQDFRKTDSAFFRSIRRGRNGTWAVSIPGEGASTRRLTCRVKSVTDSIKRDPFRSLWTPYGVEMVADQPYWRGDTTSQVWGGGAGGDFYSGNPMFTISSGYTTNRATVYNPGDVEAWPLWEIRGISTSTTLGLNGANIAVPFAIAANEVLVIDTNPRVQTAVLYTVSASGVRSNPRDRTDQLGATTRFDQPIPAETQQPLNVQITGAGTVRMFITPLYERAW